MKQSMKLIRRKQTGITLVETAIALAIAAVVVSAAFAGFQANARRSEVRDNSQLISEMIADTKQLFGPSNRYSDLDTAAAIAARVIPNNLIADVATSTTINSYGGAVRIQGADTQNNQAVMLFDRVPQNHCADLVLSAERSAASIVITTAGTNNTTGAAAIPAAAPAVTATVGTGGLVKANTSNSVIDVTAVANACSAAANSAVLFYFNRG